MIVTRKIGALIRGKTTPFQIYAACLLGAFIGFIPSFSHAPALSLFWILLLLILNANLFLAGIVGLLSKLILLVGMPLVFAVGRFLLEGPTQGLFKSLINAPVTAYSGLDYYVVAGGQLVALVLGLVLAFLLTSSLKRYRVKMASASKDSERFKKYNANKWVKVLKFLFLGSGRGKKSYEELISVRVGNPFRIWGVAVVLVFVGLLVLSFSKLTAPLITSLAKSGLEKANGATVDLENVDLGLGDGKLELTGLAMADAQNLDTNLFSSRRIVADIDTSDLLRKRFTIDSLTLEEARSGETREMPGSLVGPKPKAKKETKIPDFEDLGSVLENADEWKARLSQAKRWLEQLSGSDEEAEQAPSWKEEINSRIRTMGYANVKADFLTEGSPTLWIRKIEAKGVVTTYLDGKTLDVDGADLSTHPALAAAAPTLNIVSNDQLLSAKLSLAGASRTGENAIDLAMKQLAVDPIGQQIKSSGEPPLSGGTMDVSLTGKIGATDNDLVAQVTFADSKARIAGNPVDLDGVTLPIAIRGPLDSPGIKLESDALQKILVSTGKKKLLDEATKKLGLEGEDSEKAGQLLDGLFKKKK